MNPNREIAMIAAVGPNLELGAGGGLVWHISADLKNFKALTSGHPVIMGRKTWESLPRRPLPGRLNIVLSRSAAPAEGAVVAASPEEALRACEGAEFPFVIGGEQIYRLFLPLASRLFITLVDARPGMEVDAWFPEYRQEWRLAEASPWQSTDNGAKYRFEQWTRE